MIGAATTARKSLTITGRGRRVWLPWRDGPAIGHDGAIVVSLTDFRARRPRDLPGIYVAGLRLRAGWYAMPGAVGMWLWGQPLENRGGSLTIWQSREDLRHFVTLPAHVAIMRRYRDRGAIQADTWELDRTDIAAAIGRADAQLG